MIRCPLSPLAPALVILLLIAAPAAASDSGGVLATPVGQGEGGGGVAPSTAGLPESSSAAQREDGDGGVPAEMRQAPTTPKNAEQPEDGDGTADDTDARPAAEPGEEAIGAVDHSEPDDADAAPDTTGGFLPSTGLQLAALAAIGLGLVFAGLALRPRRRVLG